MLVILWRPGVNFINILHAHFLYGSALRSFSLVRFWQKALLYEKRVHKMLMKLTANHLSSPEICIIPATRCDTANLPSDNLDTFLSIRFDATYHGKANF